MNAKATAQSAAAGPGRSSPRARTAASTLGFVALLCIQNGLMLRNGYFGGLNIPWDFAASYHAVPFFWIEAVRAGVSPAWVPFQAMGYPLYLNSQSGFYYPAYWWFVLTQQTYTYGAAVWFQGLHILFGALGAGLCARLGGTRWSTALLAAVAYQAFGAFYSNASHPDIVRAHAILPWIMAPVLARWQRGRLFDLCAWALPVWIYCLWSGGYPGAAIATSFTAGLILVARLPFASAQERRVGYVLLAAFGAGLVAAGLCLVPSALDRMEVARAITRARAEFLGLRDIFALALRVDVGTWFGHDITMRSFALGLPVLLLLAARPALGAARWASWPLLLTLVAVAMASGLAHGPLASVIPPLGYSRYPLSDYRGLLGLGLVLLAVQSLDLLAEAGTRRRAAKVVAAGALATVAFVVAGIWLVYPGSRWIQTALVCGIVVLAAVLVLLEGRRGPRDIGGLVCVAALAVLVSADWHRVHEEAAYVFGAPRSDVALVVTGGSMEDARARMHDRLTNPPSCRPQRTAATEAQVTQHPWRGYYTGEYMMQDYSGPMKFVRHRAILADPAAAQFALRPWHAVSVRPGADVRSTELAGSPAAGMSCAGYGTTELRYVVSLDRPTRVVENELFWPGWVAMIQGRSIAAKSVAGFRAWDLPAGRYEMVARFESPHRGEAGIAFAAGFAAWLLLSVYLWRTRHGARPSPAL